MANSKLGSTSVLWVTWLIALFFICIGFITMERDDWTKNFNRWGYPDWCRMAMGGLEVVCGGLLFHPRCTWFAAMILAALMAALVATIVLHDGLLPAIIPLSLFVSLSSLTYYRYPWKTPPPPA